MLFGKMGKDPRWLKRFLQVDEATVNRLAPELEKYQQLQMLISARWIITFVFLKENCTKIPIKI
jgi:peptidyl-dipeptidase A